MREAIKDNTSHMQESQPKTQLSHNLTRNSQPKKQQLEVRIKPTIDASCRPHYNKLTWVKGFNMQSAELLRLISSK